MALLSRASLLCQLLLLLSRLFAPVSSLGECSYHHVELLCQDATLLSRHLQHALGLSLAAATSIGDRRVPPTSTSLLLTSEVGAHRSDGDDDDCVRIVCTAPVPKAVRKALSNNNNNNDDGNNNDNSNGDDSGALLSSSSLEEEEFVRRHGVGVRAIGLRVKNVHESFDAMMQRGAVIKRKPVTLEDERGSVHVAEVQLYGDVRLRLIDDGGFKGAFLPAFKDIDDRASHVNGRRRKRSKGSFGLQRFDHIVGNVWDLASSAKYVQDITGFHQFAEFSAAEVGTEESGLNSLVLANKRNTVLLPLNEPTYGSKRQSQIQTFLKMNDGPGVQHIAFTTADIISTVRQMREVNAVEFMPSPPKAYYRSMRGRLAGKLSSTQLAELERLGILADGDGEGILLQIFTKPMSDRPTLFFEFIQRIGCKGGDGKQRPGCGGFGKGNFKELFKSVEEYERDLLLL